jgi:hypothetical protein
VHDCTSDGNPTVRAAVNPGLRDRWWSGVDGKTIAEAVAAMCSIRLVDADPVTYPDALTLCGVVATLLQDENRS